MKKTLSRILKCMYYGVVRLSLVLFILSSSERGIFLPCISFSKTLQRIKQPMQRHFYFKIL